MSHTSHEIDKSFQECRRISKAANSSFVPAFRMLPRAKSHAMEALYAYMRHTDDIVDSPSEQPPEERLAIWREAVLATLGDPYADPNAPCPTDNVLKEFSDVDGVFILPAIRQIVTDYKIPKAAFFEVLYGVELDIVPKRFETFDDSADYCHAVATSVGVASLAIWGTNAPLFSPSVVKATKACGIAFQWTNFLRDIVEDFNSGRIYFPMGELKRVGLTENQFGELLQIRKSHKISNEYNDQEKVLLDFQRLFDRFLEIQFDRCETYFLIASELYGVINKDSRCVFGMMYSAYYRLYQKMRQQPRRILSKKMRLSFAEKTILGLKWRLLPSPRNL